MPFAMNNGVRIHYEVEGAGPPLVLQHGFTDSMVSWYDRGYVDALKQHNLLVLIDARGHNASDKPHDPEAYAAEHNVGDVISVLIASASQDALFLGDQCRWPDRVWHGPICPGEGRRNDSWRSKS
jgi:pimeloyl-ACP methyl ester carboxylesterase